MKQEMIKRTFQIRKNGEDKFRIWVEIPGKEDCIYGAWLPKSEIKISNRIYGFGGSRTADIEFPKTLVPLFKIV
jgi:hypothetical protein